MIGLFELAAAQGGVWLPAALLAVGLLVGILAGLFGISGGMITIPVMHVFLGIPYTLAVGSNLCAMVGMSAGGISRHRRLGNIRWHDIFIVSGGAMAATLLGVRFHGSLYDVMAGPGSERFFNLSMNSLYIAFILFVALVLKRRRPEREGGAARRGWRRTVRLVLLGEGVGFLSGLLGVGGGIVLVPLLSAIGGLQMRQAIGAALGVVFFSSVVGTIKYGLMGEASLLLALPLIAGNTIGVQAGARIGNRLPNDKLRQGFFYVMIGMVLLLAGKSALQLATL